MEAPEEFENKSDNEKAMLLIGAHVVESWTWLTAVKAKDGSLEDFLAGWEVGRYVVQVERDGIKVVEFEDGGDLDPDDAEE